MEREYLVLRIALSQFKSPQDLHESIGKHADEALLASESGCDFILFPELSLTGYAPTLASRNALYTTDSALDPIADVSRKCSITIAIGAPLKAADGVEIGMVVFHPNGSRHDYAKQILHVDEQEYFIPGMRRLDLGICGHVIVPAICFEAMQPAHGDAAVKRGATLYAVSVAKHERGMHEAHRYLSEFSRQHAVSVVIVNAVGQCEGFDCSGRSALGVVMGRHDRSVWTRSGNARYRSLSPESQSWPTSSSSTLK